MNNIGKICLNLEKRKEDVNVGAYPANIITYYCLLTKKYCVGYINLLPQSLNENVISRCPCKRVIESATKE